MFNIVGFWLCACSDMVLNDGSGGGLGTRFNFGRDDDSYSCRFGKTKCLFGSQRKSFSFEMKIEFGRIKKFSILKTKRV